MKYVKKNSKSFKSRKPVKKTVKRIKPQMSFEKKVLKVIHSKNDDKEMYLTNSDSTLTSFNSGINSAGDCLQLVPNQTNGTANNQRIGDKINLKSHTIKGYFRIVPNTTAGNYKFGNVAVRMLCLSFKSLSNYDNIINDTTLTAKLAGMLQKGGTSVGATGLISDVLSPINRDLFTVHYDKVYHIKQDYNLSAVGSSTMDTLRFYKINLKVKNKVLKYTDDVSSGLLPTNYAPCLFFMYSYLDGSLADTTSTNLQVFYESLVRYEDP